MVSSNNDKAVAVGLLVCSEEVNISEACAEVDSLRQALKELRLATVKLSNFLVTILSQLVSRFTEV